MCLEYCMCEYDDNDNDTESDTTNNDFIFSDQWTDAVSLSPLAYN